MNPWITDAALLLAGFALLAKGADGLVDGSATLARRLGVSPLLVGLTVVAWGTSLPELVVSALAAAQGRPASSLGNVLGSNVANIGLVLGSSAILLPAVLRGRLALRDAFWLSLSLAALWFVCWDRVVGRAEAGALLALFLVFNLILLRSSRGSEAVEHQAEEHEARYPWVAIVFGSAAIAFGAKFVMDGGVGIADRMGMADSVLGLTILALGTSLPELFAGVSSARRGHADIGIGNVVGSNVFNSLAVVGASALVQPFGVDAEAQADLQRALARDFPVNAGFSIVLLAFPVVFRRAVGVGPALLLVLAYLVYIVGVSSGLF